MSPLSWQCQNLCLLSLVFITDWRVVESKKCQVQHCGVLKDRAVTNSEHALTTSRPLRMFISNLSLMRLFDLKMEVNKVWHFRHCEGGQIPCPDCVSSRFCSEKCLNQANDSFHRYECGLTKMSTFLDDMLTKVSPKIYEVYMKSYN